MFRATIVVLTNKKAVKSCGTYFNKPTGATGMSIYHVYFLAVRNKKTNKVRFKGPYDKEGNPISVFSRGHSRIYESFDYLDEKDMEPDLIKEFTYENYMGNKVLEDVRIGELKEVEFPFKEMYVHKQSIMKAKAENSNYYECEAFYDTSMTPDEYAVFAAAYLDDHHFRKYVYLDADDDKATATKPTDYQLYRYIDYDDTNYEWWNIYMTASNLELEWGLDKDEENVILEVTR